MSEPGIVREAGAEPPQINFSTITRLEVIDEAGRKYTRWKCKIDPSVQDQGRTLKLFVEATGDPAPPVEP